MEKVQIFSSPMTIHRERAQKFPKSPSLEIYREDYLCISHIFPHFVHISRDLIFTLYLVGEWRLTPHFAHNPSVEKTLYYVLISIQFDALVLVWTFLLARSPYPLDKVNPSMIDFEWSFLFLVIRTRILRSKSSSSLSDHSECVSQYRYCLGINGVCEVIGH